MKAPVASIDQILETIGAFSEQCIQLLISLKNFFSVWQFLSDIDILAITVNTVLRRKCLHGPHICLKVELFITSKWTREYPG